MTKQNDEALANAATDIANEAKSKSLAKAKAHLSGEAPEEDDQPVTALDRMQRLADAFQFDVGRLVEDARSFLIEQIKSRPKPWSAMNEDEQQAAADACDHAAKKLVQEVTEAIASEGRQSVRALLTKFTHGDDIVITAKVRSGTEEETEAAVLGLHRAQGKVVLISVAHVEDYSTGEPAEIDPDQAPLFDPNENTLHGDDYDPLS